MSRNKVLRILVADDNEVNQAVVKGMLEYAGHQVDTVLNGKKAIKALKKAHYDLVIMDCLMPIMDGPEAARAIRASQDEKLDAEIPILAITALATEADRWRCMDAGMNGFISKPVRAKDLFAWILEHLGTGHASSGQPSGPQKEKVVSLPAAAAKPISSQSLLVRKMLPVLLRDAGQWQLELKAHLDGKRFTAIGLLAHKVRGTADVLGLEAMSDLAAQLETAAKARKGKAIGQLTPRLILALQQLILEIQADE